MIDAFRTLSHKPDEVEIEFGVKLDASVGAVIAGAGTGVHLNVTLRWAAEPAETEPS
jgi:hypothetical protein